ncbi:hypothetical protein QAD02_007748 [Eretmocerus hayati]|uniref:Uncharacterized protein n=1 Tax=Eretmocerus hayati TaxID=131215 RepID=A0ACC2N5Y0_9HYME|nr:hypothetical protein QAD02_007748 [Eretmocerus hayati]
MKMVRAAPASPPRRQRRQLAAPVAESRLCLMLIQEKTSIWNRREQDYANRMGKVELMQMLADAMTNCLGQIWTLERLIELWESLRTSYSYCHKVFLDRPEHIQAKITRMPDKTLMILRVGNFLLFEILRCDGKRNIDVFARVSAEITRRAATPAAPMSQVNRDCVEIVQFPFKTYSIYLVILV